MRVGISGAHGTGKTTLAEALCARLPGHVTADGLTASVKAPRASASWPCPASTTARSSSAAASSTAGPADR